MGEPGPPGEKVSGHIIGNFRPTLRTLKPPLHYYRAPKGQEESQAFQVRRGRL